MSSDLIRKYAESLSIDRLREEFIFLHAKYDERGLAMRETGKIVRSLYEPIIDAMIEGFEGHFGDGFWDSPLGKKVEEWKMTTSRSGMFKEK